MHDNKSDYGDEQEKKSYISVKLEPKLLESNASSPTLDEKKKRESIPIFKSGYSNVTNNLTLKQEKKPFE